MKFSKILVISLDIFSLVLFSIGENYAEEVDNDGQSTAFMTPEKAISVYLSPALGPSGLTEKDVPYAVGFLISKYANLVINSKEKLLETMQMMEEDFETAKKMLVLDEENNNVLFDLLDEAIEIKLDTFHTSKEMLKALTEKILKNLPNKLELQLIDPRDAIDYVILMDSFPEVMEAVKTSLSFYGKTVKEGFIEMMKKKEQDILSTILPNILAEYGLSESDLDPELLDLFHRLMERAKDPPQPKESTLDDLDKLQDFLSAKASQAISFIKGPDYFQTTDEWIELFLQKGKTFLTVVPFEEISNFMDTIASNPNDRKALAFLQSARAVGDMNMENSENDENPMDFIIAESVQDIFHYVVDGYEDSINNFDYKEWQSEVFGLDVDVSELTTEKFLYAFDQQLKPLGMSVDELSPDLVSIISRTVERIRAFHTSSLDEDRVERELKVVRGILKKGAKLLRAFVPDEIELLKIVPKWSTIVINSVVAPTLKYVPEEYMVEFFNIFMRKPEASAPFVQIQLQNTLKRAEKFTSDLGKNEKVKFSNLVANELLPMWNNISVSDAQVFSKLLLAKLQTYE